METIDEQIEYLVRNKPHTTKKLLHKWMTRYDISQHEIEQAVEGNHIIDMNMYNEAVNLLVDKDGRHGPKWTVDEVKSVSGVDFNNVDYTCLDLAYVANMLYSDYGKRLQSPTLIIGMAEDYLTDPDSLCEADERAYHDAEKRIKYHAKVAK